MITSASADVREDLILRKPLGRSRTVLTLAGNLAEVGLQILCCRLSSAILLACIGWQWTKRSFQVLRRNRGIIAVAAGQRTEIGQRCLLLVGGKWWRKEALQVAQLLLPVAIGRQVGGGYMIGLIVVLPGCIGDFCKATAELVQHRSFEWAHGRCCSRSFQTATE